MQHYLGVSREVLLKLDPEEFLELVEEARFIQKMKIWEVKEGLALLFKK